MRFRLHNVAKRQLTRASARPCNPRARRANSTNEDSRWPLPVVVTVCIAGFSSIAQAGEDSVAEEAVITELNVLPAEIRLAGANRQQQLLVSGKTKSGKLVDLTHRSEFAVADATVATANGAVVSGEGDGRTEVVVRYRDLAARIAIVADGFESYPPVHFENDVMPLFSRLHCNGSGCHGKQSGQNGFKLSVFGFDPRADFTALVKEARGRRVFQAAPDRSLLYLKSTGLMPHGGGRRTAPDSPDGRLLQNWILQGTPWGDESAPRLVDVRIEPAERVMTIQADQQVLVTAVYSDGSKRDVTHSAIYTSNAETVAGVDNRGRITTGRRPGEAAVTINYMGHVGVTRVLVPRTGGSKEAGEPSSLAGGGRIDQLVLSRLKKLGIRPSELCDDATFLRRLYLDVIGTLPTPDEVREFLADDDSQKRSRAIDRVLSRDEFADYQALRWADVLLVNSENLGQRGAFEFHRWLREQIAANRAYDQWVSELITASGNSGTYGPVNFYRALRTPSDLAKTVSQAFLGVRLDCAQCHHHPFDKWGQQDFYGLAGYFTNMQRDSLSPGREFVYHGGHKPAKMPITKQAVATRPLDGKPAEFKDGDPRIQLAGWLTSAHNRWFTRLAANRLWKQLLGRGLVEPEDDLRLTNPATNEPLLDELVEQIVASRFDLKAVTRQILHSRVYQLSGRTNASNVDDEQNFSHHLVRRMPAEVLLDAISAVTESPESFPGSPPGTRSIQLWDNRLPSYFLDAFGRSERESPCECGRSGDPTMAQALHLMNAPEIDAKISRPGGRIDRLISAGADQQTIVTKLCLAALGREPEDKHFRVAADIFAGQPVRSAAEDFLWTLMNSYEFLFIH